MSETYSRLLLAAMVAFAIFITSGWIVLAFIYRRSGYPIKPQFLKGIRLRDDIETVYLKVESALQEGFHVKERSDEFLCIEKQYDAPPCLMTIKFHRPFGFAPWSSTSVNVQCLNHRWLNRSWNICSNAYRRRKA